jgi:tetratricopeptide (TPR) repeat protein
MILDAASLSKLEVLLERSAPIAATMMARPVADPALRALTDRLGEVHRTLGQHYLAVGDMPRAAEHGRQAARMLPADRNAMLLAAKALLATRAVDEAIGLLSGVVSVDGDDIALLRLLGQALLSGGRPRDAIEPLARVCRRRPGDAVLASMLAQAHAGAGQTQQALEAWRSALAIDPDNPGYLARYGALAADAGALDIARQTYRRLTELQPGKGSHHRVLGLLTTHTADDPHMADMQSMLSAADPGGEDARELNFALFRACEETGDHARAFAHLKAANDILRAQLDYRPDVSERLFAGVEAAFGADTTTRLATVTRPDSPIFIVGMPRSGSTLTEQILSSHPDIAAAGETPVFAALVEKQLLRPDLALDLSPLATQSGVMAFGDAYFEGISRRLDPGRRIVDKYLTNFLSIGVIKAVFPKARIVHTRRDPLANCFAIYASYFETDGLGFKADLAEIARYYVRYDRLMRFWHERFPGDILDFVYEHLTQDQEAETRRLLAYCGLDWDTACLDFHRNDRAVRTASFLQVRKPLYSGVDRRTQAYSAYLEPVISILAAAGLHPTKQAA